jgi:type VII secretion integral membrane protein EccD
VTDERCRITVVGELRSVDLAVPARAPIADYVPALAGMCGQADSDAMPAAWSLAPAEGRPFEPSQSLEAAGVIDGATLYLRDALQGEFDGPVVADIAEQVAETDDDGIVWNARARAYTTLVLGLLIVLAAACALGAGDHDAPVLGPVLFAVGVAAAVLAWVAGAKAWPVPGLLRLTMAMAACPLLGLAALSLPLHGAASPVAVAVTASIGAFAAYLAAPAIATLVLQLICGSSMVLTVLLAVLHADRIETAAVTGVATFFTLSVLPRVAAQVAAMPPGPAQMDDVDGAVRRVRRLLIFLTAVCCLALDACLVVLSGSEDWYAFGLAVCLSLALLCRASSSRLRAVVAAVLTSGTAGLVALGIRAPGHVFGAQSPLAVPDSVTWLAPMLVLVAGAVVVWCGLVLCFRSSLKQAEFGERWSWPTGLANFLGAVSVPLAVGVFGVFGDLMRAGGKM